MKNKNGFTLIELLAVIVILGILAIIIIPSVTSYVNDTREQTFIAHENSMIHAAKILTVEVLNGNSNVELPTVGDKKRLYLSDLENEELIQTLNNPKGGSCNSQLSYVTITNNNGNYEYDACLYCGDYTTDSPDCDDVPDEEDETPPTCGTITGESSEWTNQNRTITIECSDDGVGCTRDKVSKTFKETAKTGYITISDRKGNTTDCPVTVNVDKTPPSCNLQIENGFLEDTGWISGTDVQISFVPNSINDGENQSGVITYGLNTSMKNPTYNKQDVYYIRDTTGTTTVIGHVKDNAGNEGMCSQTITTGVESPRFDIRYGFQIYPNKDIMLLTNATHSGVGEIHTGDAANGKGILTFTNMGYYTNVTRVAMTFVDPVDDPAAFKLTVNGRTYTATSTDYRNLEFYIENNSDGNSISSNEYQITLGKNNEDYNITRIELQRTDGELRSRYEVSVNLYQKKQLMKATSFSFNGGRTYNSSPRELMDTRYEEKYGEARAKNEMQLASPGVQYHIAKGDGSAPSVDVSLSTEDWTNQDVRITANVTDNESGIVAYVISDEADVDYYSNKWIYLSSPISTQTLTRDVGSNGNYNIYVKDFAGNTVRRVVSVTNIDKNAPNCTLGDYSLTCSDTPAGGGQGQSKVNKIYIGSSANPSDSNFKIVPVGSSYTEDINLATAGTYYLYAKDRAGNISPVQFDAYYIVHYDANGGSNPSKINVVVKHGANIDLSVTATTFNPDYLLAGWHTNQYSNEPLTSLAVEHDTTVYAVWLYKHTTIMGGWEFNRKIKSIAANKDVALTDNNTNILRIVRSNTRPAESIMNDAHRVSHAKSKYPVYMWFEESSGTMYWWSLEDTKLYLDRYASGMFLRLKEVRYIDLIELFDTSNSQYLNQMFYDCNKLEEIDVSEWDVSNVLDLSAMFKGCKKITELAVTDWDTSSATDLSSVFDECVKITSLDLRKWDVSNATDIACIVARCESLQYFDTRGWNTSNVDRMYGIFQRCFALTSLDLNHWDISKATALDWMFYNCSNIVSINISSWDTSKVTDMSEMFSMCNKLQTLDVSHFNTSSVTDMHDMFWGCGALTVINVSGWNTSNVTDMGRMFGGCRSVETLDVSRWDVSKVTLMGYMFSSVEKVTILDLSNWETNSLKEINYMFGYMYHLTTIYASEKFNLSKIIDGDNTFYQANRLTGSQGSNVATYGTSAVLAKIDGGSSNPGFFTRKSV